MEIQNVLADEMVQLGGRTDAEKVVEFQAGARTQLRKARKIADRRIEPNVEIFGGCVGNLEAEVRRIA